MPTSDLTTLQKLLITPQKIIITTHHKPDGDAMGSSLAMYHYLKQKGHQVHLITPTDYPNFLHWMPGNDDVIIYTESISKAHELLDESDLIFCLDFNALSRINDLGHYIKQVTAKKIMIDHHLEPEGFESYRLWDIRACATAELVYQFITEIMDDNRLINEIIATCLYVGIISDSGSFRFPNTRPVVHRIAADLMEKGAKNAEIHQLLFENSTEQRLRFLGFCLHEKLEIKPNLHTALITVSKNEIEAYKITTGDTEGIVNFALSIKDIKMAAFIVERSDMVKLSLRSIGDVPVNEICSKYFNGGGHKNAAGGNSTESLERTIQKFHSILPEFSAYLQ